MDNIQTVKQRFGIIGNDIQLTRALEKAVRVSPTDISVLVTGGIVGVFRLLLVIFIDDLDTASIFYSFAKLNFLHLAIFLFIFYL